MTEIEKNQETGNLSEEARQNANLDPIEFNSEEVQEVMGAVPPWILRYGILAVFIIVLVLLIGSYYFRYPDTVSAGITITSEMPPVNVMARTDGKIEQLYVANNQHVEANTLLATIQNSGHTEDIIRFSAMLKEWIEKGEHTEDITLLNISSLSLGNIQPAYAAFISSFRDMKSFNETNYYTQKIKYQEDKILTLEKYIKQQQNQLNITKQKVDILYRQLEKDSLEYISGKMAREEYDASKNNYIQHARQLAGLSHEFTQSEMQLVNYKENLLDLTYQNREHKSRYQLTLKNATAQLSFQIKNWERDYLLTSPISGTISLMGIWSNNQYVRPGEIVFIIEPEIPSAPKGRMLLPSQGSGKVMLGQKVHIRLSNYPDQEYGFLTGKVENISQSPTTEGFYIVDVSLPEGLKTNYGKELPSGKGMNGSAEIITQEMSFLERLIMPMRKIFASR